MTTPRTVYSFRPRCYSYVLRIIFNYRNYHRTAVNNAISHRTAHRVLNRPKLLHHPVYQYPTYRNGASRFVRWYSSGNQKSGGSSGGSGSGGSRKGFFQNFIDNLRRGFEKNREMQESLKGFHEEREKLEQSYVMQQARLKTVAAMEKAVEYGAKGIEMTREGLKKMRQSTSNVYNEASETEIGKKGQEIGSQLAKEAQKTAEKLSAQAEELAKTDVGQTVQRGAEIVREDLIDDIVKESAPYRPPEVIQKRSDLATDFSNGKQEHRTTIEPNEEAKEMVKTEQSKWKEQWQKLQENNPITNTFYNLKMKYDESDNLVVRASRAVTDRVGDAFSGVMSQSDMAEALAEIQKIDSNFVKEEFVKQCQFEIIPTVLEAYMRGEEAILKDWCHEAAFNVLMAIVKHRSEPGVKLDCKVLEVRDVDIVMAKVLEQGPVLVLTFQAQQLTLKKKQGEVDDELLENIFYVWALCRDQNIYDPRTAWRVLEFGIQSSGRMLV